MWAARSSPRLIESGVKCSDRVHDLLGLLRVGHQATTTIWGTGHQSLLYLNFPTRVAGVNRWRWRWCSGAAFACPLWSWRQLGSPEDSPPSTQPSPWNIVRSFQENSKSSVLFKLVLLWTQFSWIGSICIYFCNSNINNSSQQFKNHLLN